MKQQSDSAVVAHLLAFITGTRLFAQFLAGYCIVQGVSIIKSGDLRFSASAYSVFRTLPGAPISWGIVILSAGIMMWAGIVSGRDKLAALGSLLGALWSLMFSLAFALAALQNKDANLTAMWTYGKDFLIFLLLSKILRSYGKRKEGSLWKRLRNHQT